jgi:putative flippase GtrA
MRDAFSRLSGYFVTGGLAAVVDVGGFRLLREVGLVIPIAAVLSFLVAMVVNYALTSRLVFRQDLAPAKGAMFFFFATLGMIANVTLTTILATYFHLPPEIAKAAAIGATFGLNFTLNYFVVFRTRELRREH